MHTILDASKALLVEVARILNEIGVSYVVVGGWCPYLRNATGLVHPGTKDVDVLLSDAAAREGIREVVKVLVQKGFIVSAKHDFQLLRPMEVSGQKLMFNVDLLHPSETLRNPEKMVDHLDLHVLESQAGDFKFVRSIVLPSSWILFEAALHSLIDVHCPITANVVSVPLITETGCVLSKCESVKLEKRTRDAFDIYLSVVARGKERFAQDLQAFKEKDGIKELLQALRSFLDVASLDPGTLEFDRRVRKYAKDLGTDLPSNDVRAALDAV